MRWWTFFLGSFLSRLAAGRILEEERAGGDERGRAPAVSRLHREAPVDARGSAPLGQKFDSTTRPVFFEIFSITT